MHGKIVILVKIIQSKAFEIMEFLCSLVSCASIYDNVNYNNITTVFNFICILLKYVYLLIMPE